MSGPRRLPMRILVKGASTVNWTSWMGGPRADFIFSRVVEEELLSRGRHVDIQTKSLPALKVESLLPDWPQEVLGFSPDAIVLVYGHAETIHLFLPLRLERHVNSLVARPGKWRDAYRRKVLKPFWRKLAKLQAKIDSAVGRRVPYRRPAHVVRYLERYITQVHKVGHPLVVLFELLPPGGPYVQWFPAMDRRMQEMNAAISGLAERTEGVAYLRTATIVDEHFDTLEEAIPDGFHYSPRMHRLVGERLADLLDEWAATQPHLTDPNPAEE